MADSATANRNFYIKRSLWNENTLNGFCRKMLSINHIKNEISSHENLKDCNFKCFVRNVCFKQAAVTFPVYAGL